ncbi:hypothetical protein [Streptomyces aureocirculatus]|uniref:hypothetical protein n=1 Tax=Streptomyces aureocirculatus TaxID=67275 RepID=UPI0004C734ED|nr:hypothetical protein [Streptomyces aureocirculatus]
MPRPTVAQLTYGSVTVVCSALAMLLLSQASSTPGIAVITFAALGLGLLVALTVPLPQRAPEPVAEPAAKAPEDQIPVQRTVLTPDPATHQTHPSRPAHPVREPAGP